jgi:hypothetical protein
LKIKIENSKGENFMKSVTLDYFFHYTVAWDHPKNIKDVEMSEFEDQPIKSLPMPLKVVQFSPLKNKHGQIPDAIFGLRGLEKMRITIDFEKTLLIPMCLVEYISTTVDSPSSRPVVAGSSYL